MKKLLKVPIATVCLDRRKQRKRKDGSYPIRLMVYFDGKQEYYGLGLNAQPEEFDKAMRKRPDPPYDRMKKKFAEFESEAQRIISEMPTFDFKEFKTRFFRKSDINCLFSRLTDKVESLKKEGRISTSVAYSCTLKSLQKFTGKETFELSGVTVKWLNEYERWMVKESTSIDKQGKIKTIKGNSATTVGIYLRNVRHVVKGAIDEGKFPDVNYPFGEKKYEIPSGQNIKKALTLADIGKIYNYKPISGSQEHKFRDLWLFSYLANGINIKDIAKLKYKNVDLDSITFIRSKTERKNRKALKPVVIPLTVDIGRIIDTWGNKPAQPENYIFDILKPGMVPMEEYKAIQNAVKLVNKHIDKVAKSLEINVKVTGYTSRHSFASVLKRSGASIAFISESLGHSNINTTESYLSSFEMDMKKEIAKSLTNFDKS